MAQVLQASVKIREKERFERNDCKISYMKFHLPSNFDKLKNRHRFKINNIVILRSDD